MLNLVNGSRWPYIPMGMLIFICLGTVYSWSIFRKPLEEFFMAGSTASGLPFMLFLASYAFLMPVGGLLIQRFSPRAVIMFGGVLVGLGWILSGYSDSMGALAVTYGIIAGGGVGIVYGVPLAVVARWFPDNKGLAVGLTLMGFGLSPFITAPVASQLIELYGPLQAFRILGVVFLLVILLLALPFKFPKESAVPDDSRRSGKDRPVNEVDTGQMFRTGKFKGLWLCFGIGTMAGLTAIGITGPVGKEIIGLSPEHAAWAISVFAVFNGIGRPVFGRLTDKLDPFRAAVLACGLIAAASMMMLIAGNGSVIIYLASFSLLWFTLGGWLAIAPTATLIFFGQKYYSKNYGFIFTAYGVGAILGGLVSGMIRDALGSYMYVFYLLAALGLSGIAVAVLLLRDAENERKRIGKLSNTSR